jgi:hypothetical protein
MAGVPWMKERTKFHLVGRSLLRNVRILNRFALARLESKRCGPDERVNLLYLDKLQWLFLISVLVEFHFSPDMPERGKQAAAELIERIKTLQHRSLSPGWCDPSTAWEQFRPSSPEQPKESSSPGSFGRPEQETPQNRKAATGDERFFAPGTQ